MGIVTDSTARALESALDLRLERQQLLASNIVNADTPNYKPTDMEFEGRLQSALGGDDGGSFSRTDSMHLGAKGGLDSATQGIVERSDVTNTMDGNGVDMDQELVRYSDNSIRYTATLEMVRRRHGILTYTIMKMSGG
jgi:flagellar basal-body rod protein FlgB